MEHARQLRTLLEGSSGFVAPGMFDALGALLIQRHGFKCAYLGGASIAYSRFGLPDIGLVSFGEVVQVVGQIRERVEIPFIVDADTGFGNAANAQRTVRGLERAGASGIQLEDQTSPKRCGHLKGKQLIPTQEMEGKIKAVTDARLSDDTVLVARTDAIAVEGFEAALERARCYAAAGADVLFIEAPETEQQLAKIGATFRGGVPLLANMVEGGMTPVKSAAELFSLGFRMVIFPGAMVRVFVKAVQEYLAALSEFGSTDSVRGRMLDFAELNSVLQTADILENVKQYDTDG